MMLCLLIGTIPVRNVLGECILWDERAQAVWWTDIQSCLLFRYTPDTGMLRRFELPERLGSFGFIENDERLVCAFASGLALYEPEAAAIEWLARPEQDLTGTRLNDGRVDRQGRFWFGSMVEGEARDATGRAVQGSLYRLSGRHCRRLRGGIAISNSLCTSPDGATLYFADSPSRQIQAFDLDPTTGEIVRDRHFATVNGGVPDGSIVDADGYLWNAQWGAGRIVRYAPNGTVTGELALPVSQPTCVCFGGAALNRLFVTTATDGLSAEQLAAQPDAGHVLIYHTLQRGLVESRFRL